MDATRDGEASEVFAISLAVIAAASWGLSAVLVRRGLRDASTSAGTFVSLVSGLIFTALLVFVFERRELLDTPLRGVLLFGVIGMLNFPIGRFFNYMSMDRLGVGRSTPLLASAPLFAVIIAVLFTGESITPATAGGIALILGGLYVTIVTPRRGAPTPNAPEATPRARLLAGVGFALGAALAYGSSQVLVRQGVGDLATPLVGSMLALAWGTTGFAILAARSWAQRGERFRHGALYFAAGGIFSACGVMLMFQALSRGEVVVLSPVLSTNPLFTLVFAALFLRGVERITLRVVLGALLVVGGVVVLSVA